MFFLFDTAVRVRPALDSSDPNYDLVPQRFRSVICNVINPTTMAVESSQGKKVFVFDRVFSSNEAQDKIWDYVSDSVRSFVQGYNVSILAYGQSGAGKSYTMGTTGAIEQSDASVMGTNSRLSLSLSPSPRLHFRITLFRLLTHCLGIIPRAAASLFERLASTSSPRVSNGLSSLRTPTRFSMPAVSAHKSTNDRNWQMRATYVEVCCAFSRYPCPC